MVNKCSALSLLSVLCSVSAVALQLAWFVVVPFPIIPETLSMNFMLKPASLGAYQSWGIAMLVLVPTFIMGTIIAVVLATDRMVSIFTNRVGRGMLNFCAIVYVVMIITGHAVGSAETNERRADKASFATHFNYRYCSARTFEACVQGDERDVLALVGRTNTTTVLHDGESVSDAAFSIWTWCVDARDLSGGPSGSYSVAHDYKLLDDCSSSRAVDTWCGRYQSLNATLPVAEHLAMPSPFAANLHMFASYVDEWPRRLWYTDTFLGAAAGSLVLAALSCKARKKST